MKTAMRKILIRVPCFNHEKYVARCLESIAAQAHPDLDVIVIDDGSSDATASIAAEACMRYGFRFYQNAHNIGLPATLNKMVRLSGDFSHIFSIASDDIMMPGAIQALVTALAANPGFVGAYGDVVYLNADGDELGLMRNDKASGDLYEPVLLGAIALPRPWIMWTAEAYREFGLYDESMPLEDSYAFAKMARLGGICYSGGLILGYRKHPGNTSSNTWMVYQASCRLLESLRGEPFYHKLRRLYGSEHFFLLSRSHKREALRYLPEALSRPWRKQFWAALLNLVGFGFIVDRIIRR